MTEPTRGDQEVGRLGVTTLTTGNAKENSYLVRDLESGEALLFDPGQDAEWILAEIRATGATVRRLLLTHAHFDHVGAAAEILCCPWSPLRAGETGARHPGTGATHGPRL